MSSFPVTSVNLKGKRIFVSGGSRGLGKAFCTYFAQLGADVAFCYSKDEVGATDTLNDILSYGVKGLAIKASVTKKEDINNIVNMVDDEWKGIDILVNNAGISQAMPLALMEEEDWDKVFDINVKGIYQVTRAFIKSMIRNRAGIILNIGSLAGTRMIEAPIHYTASKAAIKGLTEAMSKEFARYNIRVNCIAPGLLEQGVADNLPAAQLDEYLEQLALSRVGTLAEVAALAGFMISDNNSAMTGSTILIDGGF